MNTATNEYAYRSDLSETRCAGENPPAPPSTGTAEEGCRVHAVAHEHRRVRHLGLVIAFVGMCAGSLPALAQNPGAGSARVTVQNTSANPVPVSGTVAVSNLATQSKIKNIDEPGRSPYQSVSSGGAFSRRFCFVDFAPVPSGKRLVVQAVSVLVTLAGVPSSSVIGRLRAPNLATDPQTFFTATSVGDGQWIANHQMTVYVEPGGVPRVIFELSGPDSTCGTMGTLSGYLVDLSQ